MNIATWGSCRGPGRSVMLALVGACFGLGVTAVGEAQTGDAWRTSLLTAETLDEQEVEGELRVLEDGGPDGEPTILFADPDEVSAAIEVELSDVDLAAYDELHFDLYMEHAPVHITATLRGYPDEYQGRRWYVSKRSQPLEHWTDIRLDLDLDDDLSLSEFEEPEKKLTLALERPEAEAAAADIATARIHNVRLVRNVIDVEVDYRNASYREDEALTITYPVRLTNRTDRELTAHLDLGSGGLDRFDAALEADRITLAPNERTTTSAVVTLPSRDADLPPGYAERATLRVSAPDDVPGYDAVPIRGYRPVYLFGVVPPPAERRDVFFEHMQDEAAQWSDRRVERQREHLDWRVETPPLDLTPAYGMTFRCPECESIMDVERLYVYYCYSRDIDGECDMHQQRVEIDRDHELFRAMLDRYHRRSSEIARDLALAWLASGDERFADKAMEILSAYQDMYRDLPMVSPASTGYHNRFRSATLHERHVLESFAETYIALRHSDYGHDDELDAIADGLLADALYNVNLHFYGTSASQIDMITQAMKAAVIIGQWYYFADAVTGDGGIQRILEYNFDDDGVGVDGGDYARQAVRQVVTLADFLEDLGIDVDRERIEQIRRNSALFGFVDLPEDFEWETIVLENTGVSFLVHGEGEARRRASINWGSSRERGAHDQLTYVLHDTDDDKLVLRTRRIAWGHRHSFFSYDSVSQNVPVVDEGNITRLRLSQRHLRDDGTAAGVLITDRPGRRAYPGTRLARALVLFDGRLLVIDRLASEANEDGGAAEHQFDFPVFGLRRFAELPEGMSPMGEDETLGESDAYQVPGDLRSQTLGDDGAFAVEWADEDRGLRMHFLGSADEAFRAFAGVAPSGWRAEERDFLMLRTRGEHVTAARIYEATHHDLSPIERLTRTSATRDEGGAADDDEALAYEVALADGRTFRVLVSLDGERYTADGCEADAETRIAVCE